MDAFKNLPLITVNEVFFPRVTFSFASFNQTMIAAIEEALAIHDGHLVITTLQDSPSDKSSLYAKVGVLIKISTFTKIGASTYDFGYDAISRFVIENISSGNNGYPLVDGESFPIPELDNGDAELMRLHQDLKSALIAFAKDRAPHMVKNLESNFNAQIKENKEVSSEFLLAEAFALIEANGMFRQKLLETLEIKALYKMFLNFFKPELEKIALNTKKRKVQQDITQKTQAKLEKQQKEYMLKEQLKTIKKELGEDEDEEDEYLKLMKRYSKIKLPKEADEKIKRELKRFQKMNSATSEYQSVENYIHNFLSFPWSTVSEKKFNLAETQKILTSEHFGIEHVKKRIIEYLSALQFTKDIPAQILCFYGPPGVGKTSICKSIAHALGREYVRISLGGVSDEAEIRGHRRTYVGALPGKIVQALLQAKTSNPVVVLDEIDKVGKNQTKGSVESALLEVLDPEQNKTFQDHYLSVGVDLSKVIFIATANDISQISAPLRDRMEMIELYSYTPQEKVTIAQNFLIPQEKKNHGLDKYDIQITPEAVKRMVLDYTQESGVRNLRKKIASIYRQCAVKILEGQEKIIINEKNIKDFLGEDIILHEKAKEKLKPGMATGLAWTSVGGEILFVEASKMKGSGQLKITGQLGEVMRESAQIALSYVRSHESKSIDFNEKTEDLHIHVPAGATPKDGPSAGVTLATTIVSLLSNRSVKAGIAMTGEISLQGDVLAVGGIKEKVIAAYNNGIKEVIIPEDNRKDINKLPAEIKNNENFKIHPVSHISEVIKLSFEP